MEWDISDSPVPYPTAVARMEARVQAIRAGRADELIWLLEHPPLYTAGTSADPSELKDPDRFPVFESRRGGRYTYHGPGQRVAYAMLDLDRRGRDVRRFVWSLEEWVIRALDRFAVRGERREGRVGVWVTRPDLPPGPDGAPAERKIAAIGVRLRRWVSFHGVAINVEPDLSHFDGITPCGIAEHGVTSLVDLGIPATLADCDVALRDAFPEVFDKNQKSRRDVATGVPAHFSSAKLV
jgi:lipoyl(octanoyl) transferase